MSCAASGVIRSPPDGHGYGRGAADGSLRADPARAFRHRDALATRQQRLARGEQSLARPRQAAGLAGAGPAKGHGAPYVFKSALSQPGREHEHQPVLVRVLRHGAPVAQAGGQLEAGAAEVAGGYGQLQRVAFGRLEAQLRASSATFRAVARMSAG